MSNRGDWTHGPQLDVHYKGSNAPPTQAESDMLKEAYDFALDMAAEAIAEIRKSSGGNHTQWTGALMATETNDRLLDHYFGPKLDALDYNIILTTMLDTRRGLLDNSGTNRLTIYNKNTTRNGFVRTYSANNNYNADRPIVNSHNFKNKIAGQLKPKRKGHIHLNLNRGSSLAMARTLLHEATHRFSGTADFSYLWDAAKFNGLSKAEKINNADSYAHYAVSVYKWSHNLPDDADKD